MKIALIAPPYIPVPPSKYGGTELFIAELARRLQAQKIDVTVYTVGESQVEVPIRYVYERGQWPLKNEVDGMLKALSHAAWAMRDAAQDCNLVHTNSAHALAFSRFIDTPVVHTVHHAFEKEYADYYQMFPQVSYVTISDFQRRGLSMPKMRTIHHGIDPSLYPVKKDKQQYFSFLGRIAPPKGTHLAVEIAQKTGIPLKIAGEIQPMYQGYWESRVKPHVDGKFIEYLGEMGLQEKIELLGNSMAMLFPIQWHEPFGLVMIEAMACGTPVLALSGGSVNEVVKEGVSGHIRANVDELAACARNLAFDPQSVRGYMEKFFSVDRMAQDYVALYKEILEDGVKEVEQIVA